MKTKNLLPIYIATVYIVMLTLNSIAQSPTWQWAKSAGGSSSDYGRSVATDGSGNIVVTGNFSFTIDFGTTTLTNAGVNDIFIVKYDAAGNVLWAKRAGGGTDEYCYSVATDDSGNIFITGSFYGSTLTFGTTTLINAGNCNMFIVKYDAAGNVLWAKSAGGSDYDGGNSVATDGSGNVLVTGDFSSFTIDFGTTTLNHSGSNDMFIVKYDGAGNVLWAKGVGDSDVDYGQSVAVDDSGNILVTGNFKSSALAFSTTTLTNAGNYDMFIVKYDSNGNELWAKSAGGSFADYGNSIATDAIGNIVVTGNFKSSALTFGTTTLTNAGINDMFIVKYDAGGNILWAKSAGGSNDDYGQSVAIDGSENIVVTGIFGNSTTITFGTFTLTNAGSCDMFIVKYNTGGNALWAKSAGGSDVDYGQSVATDGSGNIVVVGIFKSSILTFGTTTLTNVGNNDMFIAKINTPTGIENIENSNGIVIYPNPSNGKFMIKSNNINSIEIYNLLGEKIYSTTNNTQTTQMNIRPDRQSIYDIDISHCPKEMYFVKIYPEYSGEKIYTEKIVIQ